jgi:hypothetical protein
VQKNELLGIFLGRDVIDSFFRKQSSIFRYDN